VMNQFGGNCLSCHGKARPEFDFVCEQGHGCDPLPLPDSVIQTVQASDPRCTQ
jgi:mono/diheme cytochrome c family protein